MASKYPPTQRVTASQLSSGDQVLIRERLADQPYALWRYDQETRQSVTDEPLATGVWTVLEIVSALTKHPLARRAVRTYTLTLEHPGAGQRTLTTSPAERWNYVTP